MRLLLSLWAVSSFALAAPCESARLLAENVTTPCSGLLISEDQAKAALLALKVTIPKLEADLKLSNRVNSALEEQRQQEKTAYIAALEAAEAHNQSLAAEGATPWWESPLLWGPLGFAVGAVATVAIIR